MKTQDETLIDQIKNLKSLHGKELVILGHFYQRKEIIDLSDCKGDSFDLSKRASNLPDAKYIIFCGVHFMAESAAVLAKPGQIVQLPALDAGCPMADMADYDLIKPAWDEMNEKLGGNKIIPVTYMNSTAEIKAFCGQHDGSVCTSSNAHKVFRWALEKGGKIFFMPDEHLGRNTANKLGIPKDEIFLWDYNANPSDRSAKDIAKAKIILWKGYCHVHTFFTTAHIKSIRDKFPQAVIIAHPECTEEVIAMVDHSGSTAFIENYVKNAPDGATIAIATEINMTDRLSREFPNKNIFDVARSLCPNMYKNNLNNLKKSIENIGTLNVIKIDGIIKESAAKALKNMLDINELYQ